MIWSRARSRLPTASSTISCCCAPTACRPTTSAWSSTTWTWTSRTSSAATTTSTTRRARSISSERLGAPLPQFAHVPMILGADGERLSKRHGAVSVMQYRDDGYLPEALINYLARLGWSHGDEEIFSREQLVEWFDLRAHQPFAGADSIREKLQWLNQQYLKAADDARLAELVRPFLEADGCDTAGAGPADSPRW